MSHCTAKLIKGSYTVHFEHAGACITATAIHANHLGKSKICNLKEMAELHDIKVKPGFCTNPPLKCKTGDGYRICGSTESGAAHMGLDQLWGEGGVSMYHVREEKGCTQFNGVDGYEQMDMVMGTEMQ